MSDTVLAHPLVRSYLRVLDERCASLPYDQARELHEQIAGHLEEALPPGTSDAGVQAELKRLGRPYAIAAAAVGPGRPSAGRRLWNRLGHIRWWTWTVTAVLVPVLAVGIWFVVAMNSVAPLLSLSDEWLYSVDASRATQASADEFTQSTAPARFGQRMGLKLLLVNQSDWTQTITGFGDSFQPFSASPWQASVQTGPDINPLGVVLSGGDSYVPWGSIPPHSTRWVHLTWLNNTCAGTGVFGIIDTVPLEVKVGLTHKTENIFLNRDAYALDNPGKTQWCPPGVAG